ncbi:hypothetical protein [Escherichia coli]|uniref:hypothetical protein n=2 Tax=Escherichia coli TaxID=562 RepID=UPI00200C79E0|nr:hypothetical protein [Escherichia coli]
MSKYYIESQAGVIMGIYEGASAEDAVAALNADAGGSDSVAADWIVIEVVDVDQDWEHEATLYTLSNGGVLVESGPHRRYYRDMRAARAALSD